VTGDLDGGQGGTGFDSQGLFEAIERAILGSPRRLTRIEVAEQADVPLERAIALWRSLGFPGAEDDQPMFIDADVEALRMVTWLVETGFVDPSFEVTLARSMGLSFARLAEWEVAELAAAALGSTADDPSRVEETIASLIPVVEDVQNYVWRRHLAHAAGRILLRPDGNAAAAPMAVGFADIVGFTRRSREIGPEELAHLVEVFERVANEIVTENHGRLIKTIGDEVLFVADDPVDMGRIALALVDGAQREPDFPEVRVGAAHGEVLSRMGDVFGPVVNIAARLTSLARPSRVLVDNELAEVLRSRRDEFRVKHSRTTSVKGYSRLDTWSVKRLRTDSGGRHDDTHDDDPREDRRGRGADGSGDGAAHTSAARCGRS